MGQYYKICNVDKKEYISPYDFGGLGKLMEFSYPMYPDMVTAGLTILLADGNNRGGGDLRSDDPIIGSWKYNRIVVCGDYADPNPEFSKEENLYRIALPENGWVNVSFDILSAMMDDGLAAHEYGEYLLENYKRNVPGTVIAAAHAHKFKQYATNNYPSLAIEAELFFEKLFPDKNTRYYKTINGICKHHPIGSRTLITAEDLSRMDKRFATRNKVQIKYIDAKINTLESEMQKLKEQRKGLSNWS